jgi:DNA adenine methylase
MDLDPLEPPLKWAGGKRWLISRLQPIWQHHASCRLVEPFAGGLSVALGLCPKHALLNDASTHLINFYCWLQTGLVITIPCYNDPAQYYDHRLRFNELITQGRADTKEAAELFYYLNRTGYNGLCRFNRKGLFNVPFGRHACIRYRTDLTPYAAILGAWRFQAGDFMAFPIQPGDFVYADPPYDGGFTAYAGKAFSWTDQVRLAQWLASLKVPVVASNRASERVLSLYTELGFHIALIDAPRSMAANGGRARVKEMFAMNLLA